MVIHAASLYEIIDVHIFISADIIKLKVSFTQLVSSVRRVVVKDHCEVVRVVLEKNGVVVEFESEVSLIVKGIHQ